MSLADSLIKRRKLVVVIWVVALIAAFPAIMGYSGYISYSTSSSSSGTSESAVANSLLQKAIPQNESLTVVVSGNPYSSTALANTTLAFQDSVASAGIANVTGTSSPYSEYASYLNAFLKPASPEIRGLYNGISNASQLVYSFPAAFLGNWSAYRFSPSQTYEAAIAAGYNNSTYEHQFLSSVNSTSTSGTYGTPDAQVQAAVNMSASVLYNASAFAYTAATGLSISNYTTGVPALTARTLSQASGYMTTAEMVLSAVKSSEPGSYYVTHYTLKGVPAFISDRFISNDSATFLISVSFNTSSNYVSSNGSTPSQIATPSVQKLASTSFGSSAAVTGTGAIAYQTQQVTAQSGIAFGFIFVILAVAVFLTLISLLASVITLVLVSIATVLGYVSIYITGLLFQPVDYVVNYTLTAVILGVATDYIVFILSRYRQEIRLGRSPEEAVHTATSKAGKAVLVSGIAVAASLGMFSFIPGFRTWGTVLFGAILLTVIMEVTLLPAIMKLLGPRIFLKRSLKPLGQDHYKSSFFYRASKTATKRKAVVLGIIFILAAPSMYLFFTLPTTYDFNTGLPADLSSVQALHTIESKFGANVIYPVYIILPLNGSSGGTLSTADMHTLQGTAHMLNSTAGINRVVGPYFNNITSASGISPFIFDNGNYSYFIAYTPYGPYSSSAEKVVGTLRDNSTILVGGITSSVIDQKAQNQKTYTELAVLIVAAIAVILFVAFRTPKYPIISLSGVFISIVWTTALLYFISVFLLHESLIYLIPVILFVILMSLGNDYTIFVISRIREEEDPDDPDEGIARGMVGSGKVVTSLGLILAASLGSLAFIPVGFLQQLGIAFIISLILDTFVIRTLYFPAMVSLMTRKKRAVEH